MGFPKWEGRERKGWGARLVETCLGWVLSGPMKGRDVDGRFNVNFVTQQNESELQHMWDLETHRP